MTGGRGDRARRQRRGSRGGARPARRPVAAAVQVVGHHSHLVGGAVGEAGDDRVGVGAGLGHARDAPRAVLVTRRVAVGVADAVLHRVTGDRRAAVVGWRGPGHMQPRRPRGDPNARWDSRHRRRPRPGGSRQRCRAIDREAAIVVGNGVHGDGVQRAVRQARERGGGGRRITCNIRLRREAASRHRDPISHYVVTVGSGRGPVHRQLLVANDYCRLGRPVWCAGDSLPAGGPVAVTNRVRGPHSRVVSDSVS